MAELVYEDKGACKNVGWGVNYHPSYGSKSLAYMGPAPNYRCVGMLMWNDPLLCGNIRLTLLASPARLDIVIGNNIDDYECLELPTATWRCLFHGSHTLGINCLLISLNTPT